MGLRLVAIPAIDTAVVDDASMVVCTKTSIELTSDSNLVKRCPFPSFLSSLFVWIGV